MPPQYNPKETEDKIYRLWEESGFFNPDKLPGKREKPFVVVVPPPNVTGSLHLGHALNATIQDILIRKRRMEGYKTLWLPGTDHAGIATQNVVEKELKKEGKTRYDIGREMMVRRIWQWKEKYGSIILDQFKKLGSSMDWSRTRFTMDDGYKRAVEEVFVKYYEKGWVYRAERVINWCPRCQTSLSDLELEYKEDETKLYFIRYPLVSGKGRVVVATTRPETMLGDAAVAVNPKDERYKKMVGEKVVLPIQNREISIISDDAIEMEFGTGAVKVTPSHDLLDAEIGERHKLSRYTVIDPSGKMTAGAGAVCIGLKTEACREKVIEELKKLGLLEKEEPYKHNVAVCYRCATVIEPIPSLQWFLKMAELAKLAVKAVKSGKVKFHPDRWQKVYLDRLEHEKDWTISRQIWWGHRIPVGYCVGCGEIRLRPEIKGNWFFVRHGETDWNVEGRIQGQSAEVSLNDKGRQQAHSAAEELKQYKIDLVISSDSERAKETGEIIAKELGAEIVLDEALRERKYGILEGLTREDIAKNGLQEVRVRMGEQEFSPDGGESLKEVGERAHEALQHHRSTHKHKNIVIVSHGTALRSLLRRLKNILPGNPADREIHNAQVMHFAVSSDCKKCGSDFIELDDSVLDTWFSSALWPFATLGWPFDPFSFVQGRPELNRMGDAAQGKPDDLKSFYPTNVLSTARDIISIWVAKMVFSGLEFAGKPPFSDVIIHATILTKEGKRMSKSLGTGVDPMVLIDKYGADALRFGLIWQAMGTQDIHWSEEHVLAGKKFANKIWNISRFVFSKIGKDTILSDDGNILADDDTTRDFLGKLEGIRKSVDSDIEKFNFGQALHTLYDFTWHDFADKYLEYSKTKESNEVDSVLAHTLIIILKLLHPFMPFVTEEIWLHLSIKDKKPLIVEQWPR